MDLKSINGMKLVDRDVADNGLVPQVVLHYDRGPSKEIELGAYIDTAANMWKEKPTSISWRNCNNVKPTYEVLAWAATELASKLHPKAYRFVKSNRTIIEGMRNS